MTQNGLLTQCVQASTAKLCNVMTLAQLCLQVNIKMGGINNKIKGFVSIYTLNFIFWIILKILHVLLYCNVLADFSIYQQGASIKAYFGHY